MSLSNAAVALGHPSEAGRQGEALAPESLWEADEG